MPLSSSLRSPFTQPTGKGSAFSRKVAAGVRSLVGRVESLTKTHSLPSEAPPCAETSRTDRASPLRRWGESLLERATLFAEQNLTAIPAAEGEPGAFGVVGGRQATDYAYDGYGSTMEGHSTIIGTDAGSNSSRSTPPVARVVPSSFFRQLLRSNEKTARRVGASVRQVYGRRGRRTSPKMSVHDLRGNAGAKKSAFAGFKRKPAAEGEEVEGLVRRCQEAEGAGGVVGDLGLKEQSSFRVLRREAPEERGRRLPPDEEWVDEDSPHDDMERFFLYTHPSHSCSIDISRDYTSSPRRPLVCWDKRYLNTDFEYMPDGSLSNFGYLMRRLEFEAGILRPDSETGTSTTVSFAAPGPKRTRVYKKTPPPPHGFFNPMHRRVPAGVERRLGGPEIVCPEPLNAVQSAELRGFAFRYT